MVKTTALELFSIKNYRSFTSSGCFSNSSNIKTHPVQDGICADDEIDGPQCSCATEYTGTICQICATNYHTANGLPASDTNACISDFYGPNNAYTRCTKMDPCVNGECNDSIDGSISQCPKSESLGKFRN